jgi:hypothetical protein
MGKAIIRLKNSKFGESNECYKTLVRGEFIVPEVYGKKYVSE